MARVSNGLFLQVLTRPPSVGVPIEVDVYAPDGATMLATLQDATAVKWQDTLDDVGSGSFTINRHDAKATSSNLAKGNIVKIKVGGVYRFAYVLEEPEVVVIGSGGKHEETYLCQGRGVLSLLDRAVIYPTGWPSPTAANTVAYTGSGGSMLWALLVLAQARGALSEITFDDWATTDSLNDPWPDTEQLTFHVGANYLDVAKQLVALDVLDLYMDPQLHLWAYVSRSRDLSQSIVFRAGRHIADDKLTNKKHYSAVKSRVLVEGAATSGGTPQWEEVIGANESDPQIGRREGYLGFSASSDPTTLNQVGVATLLGTANDSEPLQLPVIRGTGAGDYEPYRDYVPGDYISVDVPGSYSMSKQRIMSMTVAQRAGGTDFSVVLDLNSIYVEALLRLAERLSGKTGGGSAVSGGSAATLTGPITIAPPNVPISSGTVVGPDVMGAAATAGTATTYSRGDHDHGLPALVDGGAP